MIADGQQVTMSMGVRPRDLNYGLIPFGHSYGLGSIVLPLITRGIPVLCGTAALPQAVAADFARWQPTAFPGVPPVFRALAEADLPRDAFASMRVAISAGAPLPPETARAFAEKFGRRVHAFYGSSETGGIAYDRTGAATLAGSVGTPLRGVRITARPGQRICICSAAVFTHGNPRRHGSHGCWVPPDRAAIDPRGCITLLGRRGTVVKIAGRRVNLGEIATRLRRVRGVRDVWVGVSSGAEAMLGAAVIADRAIADLRAEMLTDTAAWKIPKRWALRSEFPLTNRGKTDTRALQAAVFR